jgi:hypothetical protein
MANLWALLLITGSLTVSTRETSVQKTTEVSKKFLKSVNNFPQQHLSLCTSYTFGLYIGIIRFLSHIIYIGLWIQSMVFDRFFHRNLVTDGSTFICVAESGSGWFRCSNCFWITRKVNIFTLRNFLFDIFSWDLQECDISCLRIRIKIITLDSAPPKTDCGPQSWSWQPEFSKLETFVSRQRKI